MPKNFEPDSRFVDRLEWQLASEFRRKDRLKPAAGKVAVPRYVIALSLAAGVLLMGVAANFIAGLLNKHRWIAYVGLVIILYVAGDMIWRGALEVQAHAFTG